MKTRLQKGFFLFALVLLFLPGCVVSLHPLYTPDKIVFRKDLLGTWEQIDEDETWLFEQVQDEQAYSLTLRSENSITDEVSEEVYKAHLVKLGDYYFLDFYPEPDDKKNQPFTLAQMLRTHGFARVDFQKNGQVRLLLFEPDWIKKLFEERRIRLQHEELEDGTIVLTAPSAELQKFFEKYANEKEAYMDPAYLRRGTQK